MLIVVFLGRGNWEARNDIIAVFISIVRFCTSRRDLCFESRSLGSIIRARSYVSTNARMFLSMYLVYGNLVYVRANYILDGSSKVMCVLFRSSTRFLFIDYATPTPCFIGYNAVYVQINISPGMLVHVDFCHLHMPFSTPTSPQPYIVQAHLEFIARMSLVLRSHQLINVILSNTKQVW